MKKTKLILACLAIAVALGGLTGCMFPDYQLDMDVYATSMTGGSVATYDSARVGYTLRNVGSRDLTNVQITAELWRNRSTGGSDIEEVSLGAFSIDVGETITGSSALYEWLNDGGDSNFDAYIISVGWDADD